MRLTRYTDYALRVLMYLASSQEKATIADIAQRFDISKNHLMKVVQQLNQLGYVSAIRGKNGGLQLGREPEQINLGQLIRDTESDFFVVECFDVDNDSCSLTPACKLKHAINKALHAFLQVLDGYTLKDLVSDSKHKTQILKLLN